MCLGSLIGESSRADANHVHSTEYSHGRYGVNGVSGGYSIVYERNSEPVSYN